MSSLAKTDEPLDQTAATALQIARGSLAMLNLVVGDPEFERLASLLDRARSEALRVSHLRGVVPPPAPGSTADGREPRDHDG